MPPASETYPVLFNLADFPNVLVAGVKMSEPAKNRFAPVNGTVGWSALWSEILTNLTSTPVQGNP